MLGDQRAASPKVVVALPEEIDGLNAARVEEELVVAIGAGGTVIADMSATTFCDSAGVRAVVQAWKQAAAAGGEVRVVVGTSPVRRILNLTAMDQVLSIYDSLDAALAGSTPALPARPPGAGDG
jgi:anti-sigma B factor antagonist